jgi:SAM-dependent methyltransferase
MNDVITPILHRFVSIPWVYNQVQKLAGIEYVRKRLAAQIAQLDDVTTILDLGGGTGLNRDLWSPDSIYLCLDIDRVKLQGFLQNQPDGIALLADGSQIPLKANSLDIVICISVLHHLSDPLITGMIHESARVLKSSGRFILLDPVWAPARPLGRLLWKYDRGSDPRSAESLLNLISTQYKIDHKESFSVFHEYFLCVASKKD